MAQAPRSAPAVSHSCSPSPVIHSDWSLQS
jgi:hypothetical protein